MFRFSTLRTFDWWLVLIVLMLTTIGFAAIYSVDLSRGTSLVYFPVQSIALGISLVLLGISSLMHMRLYQLYARWIYVLSVVLLVAVLQFGVTIRGTTGWFRIAGFSFQPAEFAKVGIVIGLGWLISRYGRRFYGPHFFLASALLTMVSVGLIMMQPDLGSALVLMGAWFGYLIAVGVEKKYIFTLIGSAVAVFVIAWFFLFQPYQKNRILTFIDPERDPLGAGYNVTQSVIAIGSGQFFGRGLGFGSQSQLHFLPEAQTDFVFAVIAEELGFIGSSFLLLLFFALLWRLLHIVRYSRSEFGSYVVLGIAFVFFMQLVFNIGGALGLLPITGVTLPFVSYGGSSLIINFLLIGIVQSIAHASLEESQIRLD